MSKSILRVIYSCSLQKTTWRDTKYSRNETILKIGHHAKPIAFAKSSLWVKNYNSKKHVKIYSTSDLQLFSAKNRLKRHQILEKWDHFEDRPSCKAYSLCKIVNLSQKLNFQKTCQNLFYKRFTVVLCKKPLEKTPNTREMRPFWKSAFAKSSLWVKNYNSKKHVKIYSISDLQLFCAKNRLKKHQIFEKWDYFKYRPSCKAYSLCKIVTLGHKLQFQKTCQNLF